jgi:hypothetical protein
VERIIELDLLHYVYPVFRFLNVGIIMPSERLFNARREISISDIVSLKMKMRLLEELFTTDHFPLSLGAAAVSVSLARNSIDI